MKAKASNKVIVKANNYRRSILLTNSKAWLFWRLLAVCYSLSKSLMSLLLSPLDLWNLWNPFNRIRIIMGKFGCTQIRTSSSCSSERGHDFGNLFFGFWIFCPEVSSAFWQNPPKTFLGFFVKRPIKPLGKIFRTQKTDCQNLFSCRSYKSLKFEFVCSRISPL